MAVNAEFLNPLFEGIEGGEEKVGKVLAEYEADVVGLRRKTEELLQEKKQIGEKHEALSKEKQTLEVQIKELDEKLKANLPDKERQAFEAEIERYKTNAVNIASELKQQIEEREGKIKALEADHHRYICQAEFDKLANADSGIIPELREPLRKLFFTDNEFEWVDISGERQLRNKASKLMKDVLADFLNTPAGQYFRVSKNTGGGAPGSNGGRGAGNRLTREQFDALPAVQKQDFFAKGGRLA
jgi:DNA repair exonuclease SbcCD ATPase subunit